MKYSDNETCKVITEAIRLHKIMTRTQNDRIIIHYKVIGLVYSGSMRSKYGNTLHVPWSYDLVAAVTTMSIVSRMLIIIIFLRNFKAFRDREKNR